MSPSRLAALLGELEEFENYIDNPHEAHDDPLELEIMKICMRIPAGYEDLLGD
jgi:hypothetical protein